MDPKDKTMLWNPTLKKETKHYEVSYHLPKDGERIKLNISTEHPKGSPAFINQVHLDAKKLGHKLGSVGASQEILALKPSEMIESGTPHTDLAQEFTEGMKQKNLKPTKLGKTLFDKCSELLKAKNPLRAGAANRNKVFKPQHKEGDLPNLLNPVLFNKPKSSIKEFLTHEDAIKDKIEEPKEEIKKADSNPAQYATPAKFSKEELLAAVRQDIIAELDAVNLYGAHKVASDDKDFNEKLEHIISEEKEHAKELQEVLHKLDPEQKKIDQEEVKKSIDPEDLHEHGPKSKDPIISGLGSKVPKPPLMFEFDKPAPAFKRGDKVEFTSQDMVIPLKGNVENIKDNTVHIREENSDMIHRIPIERVKLAKSIVSYLLSKSISNTWIDELSKEFETLAKSYGMEYKYISMPSGMLHYNLFKIGNCSVIHKTMGKLIDVKISYPGNSVEEQRSLAKALFYKLLTYYKRDAIAKNYEIYELPDSFGIFESDELLTKAMDILKARSGWWGQSGPTASGQKISSAAGTSVLDYMNRKYSQKLRRKQHPRAYKKKMSPALRMLQRHYRYLFGAEKPVPVQSAAVKKSIKLTGFGKQMVKAFGAVKMPSVGIKTSPKKPSISLGAPKMAKPISSGKLTAGPKMSLASPKPKMPTIPKLKV